MHMSEGSTRTGWLGRRRRYRRLAFGTLIAGIIGFLGASFLDYPGVGLGLYWLGFVGFFGVRRWAPMALFDERDLALERQSSYDTLRLAGIALITLAPATATLEEVSAYEIPAILEGAIWGYAALFVVFGASYLARRYRP